MAKTNFNLNPVFSELIQTEEGYNQSLRLIHEFLGEPEFEILKESKAHIKTILEISNRMLGNISTAINEEISDEEREALRVQRRQLFKLFFEAYKEYTNFYQKFISEMNKNPQQFSNIQQRLIEQKRLGLQDYLIMPIQRGPRFQLLIEALINNDIHLNKDNKAKEELESLIITIKKCMADANKATAKNEKPQGRLAILFSKFKRASGKEKTKPKLKNKKATLNYDLINQAIDTYVEFAEKDKKEWNLDVLSTDKKLILWRVSYLMYHLEKQAINIDEKDRKRMALDKIAHHLIREQGIEPKNVQFFNNKFYKNHSAEMLFHLAMNQNIQKNPANFGKFQFLHSDVYVYFRDNAMGLSSPGQEILKHFPIAGSAAAFLGALSGTMLGALATLIVATITSVTFPLILPAALIIGTAIGVTLFVGACYFDSKKHYRDAVEGAIRLHESYSLESDEVKQKEEGNYVENIELNATQNYPKLFESSKDLEKRYKIARKDQEKDVRTSLKLGLGY